MNKKSKTIHAKKNINNRKTPSEAQHEYIASRHEYVKAEMRGGGGGKEGKRNAFRKKNQD